MTPTTRSLRENAFAFVPQRKKSSAPACAVEESHAWKPTEKPPASNPRCSRTRRIPPTIDWARARARALEREARHEQEVRAPVTARLDVLADRVRERRIPRRRRRRRHPDLVLARVDVAGRRVGGDALGLARPRVDAMDLVGDLVRRPHRSFAVGETGDPRLERDGSRDESPVGVDAPHLATLGIGRPHRAPADREVDEEPCVERQPPSDRVRGAVDLGDDVLLGDPDVAVARCDVLGSDLPDPGDDPVRSRVDARDGEIGVDHPDGIRRDGDVLPAAPREHVRGPPIGAGGSSIVSTRSPDSGSTRDTLLGKTPAADVVRADPDAPGARRDVGRRRGRAERPDDGSRLRVDLRHGPVVGVEHPDASLPHADGGRRSAERDARDHLAGLGIERAHAGLADHGLAASGLVGGRSDRDSEHEHADRDERPRPPPRRARRAGPRLAGGSGAARAGSWSRICRSSRRRLSLGSSPSSSASARRPSW